jgi:cell wall-associated NlpC family hydrolase
LKYNGIPPYAETQNYVRVIMASAESFSGGDDAAAQHSVGPDGCPSRAPGNTLRRGAASMGIGKLCADSVAGARTPQAAVAIKYALAQLGTPYSQSKRNQKGWYDCSSLTGRAYASAGVYFTPRGANNTRVRDYIYAVGTWTAKVSQEKPGDMYIPQPGHIGMYLAHGYMVHSSQPGDVTHVTKPWGFEGGGMKLKIIPQRVTTRPGR